MNKKAPRKSLESESMIFVSTENLSILSTDDSQNSTKSSENETLVSQDDKTDISINQLIPLCKHFLRSRCRHGVEGKDCKFRHEKVCRKWLNQGNHPKYGCTLKDKCEFFHPKICWSSVNSRICTDHTCSFNHIRGTRREVDSFSPKIQTSAKSHNSIDHLYLYNIDGLYPRCNQTKVPTINEIIIDQSKETKLKPKAICIVESHLNPDIENTEVQIEDYNLFRTDRAADNENEETRIKGGVALYLHSSLTANILLSKSNNECEALIIKVNECNSVIALLYRPPSCNHVKFKPIIDEVSVILNKERHSDIIFLGDFNFPEITWSDTLTATVMSSTPDRRNQIDALLSLTEDLFLNQLITFPTRQANTLDLLFTNTTNSLYDFEATDSKMSDHKLLEIRLTAPHSENTTDPVTKSETKEHRLNYFKADFSSINKELMEVNWNELLKDKSVADQYEHLLHTVNEVCRKYTPEARINNTYRSKFYKERRALMRKRRRILTAINKCKHPVHKESLQQKFNNIESQIRTSHEKEQMHDETEAVKKISTNTKYFYAYARRKQKSKDRIGPLIEKSTSEIISDDQQIADKLQQQFCSVFSKPSEENKIHDAKSFFFNTKPNNQRYLDDIQFTNNDIERAISELKSTSAPGLDGFPAVLLKNCAETLSTPLHIIFRHSLDTGEVPSLLKDAIIVPIHKGGLKSQPQNYRPINLISHILKVLEKLIRNSLVYYLEEQEFMNPNQHAFRKYRSCLSQLLEHFDELIETISSDKNCDVLYLDFAKAFDVVNHDILMKKLHNFGITGKIGYWIHNFLTNRHQTVTVNKSKSKTESVLSGVPQGSVLGPILFIIFISDIDDNIDASELSVFADDTKIKKTISTANDSEELQSDLKSVYQWGTRNCMSFNDLKFKCMKYGRHQNLMNGVYTSPAGNEIDDDEHVKDLGILMSNDLRFTKHIDKVTARCRSLIAWTLRTFNTRNKVVMLTLLKSLILPRIDYCSQLYSPFLQQEWNKLESIQRRFTSHIEGMKDSDYWSRLQTLRLYSIQRRCERYSIIYTWKILNKLAPNLRSNPITTHISERRGLYCHVPKINRTKCPAAINTIREGSLAVRGPRLYNSLPRDIRNLQGVTVEVFKRALDKFLSQLPDMPAVSGYAGRRSTPSNSLVHVVPSYLRSVASNGGRTRRP